MKTILHMIETGGTGGAETVYLDLVRRLDPVRWRHVPVLPRREWMYEQLIDFGIEPILIPERWSLDPVFFANGRLDGVKDGVLGVYINNPTAVPDLKPNSGSGIISV